MALAKQDKALLLRLQAELREAMERASQGRMALTSQSAADATDWGSKPSPELVRQADQWGAEAEEKWRELDALMTRLRF